MNTNTWLFKIFLCLPMVFFAQGGADQDTAYLEDQLFFSLGYTSLMDTPNQFQQNGFSYGLSLGFIKDIPFNKRRNLGVAVGVGYAWLKTFPQYEKKLGAPKGYAKREGYIYTRSFEHLDVWLDIKNKTATLNYK